MDIAFATRYLDAWEAYFKCKNSWYPAYEAAKNKNIEILASTKITN